MFRAIASLLIAAVFLGPALGAAEEFDGFRVPCANYLLSRRPSPVQTIRDIYVDLAGAWTATQIQDLDDALMWPHEHRVRTEVGAEQFEFPRYIVFFHGQKFSVVTDESAESHQYIFEIPARASVSEIATFLDGKLPAVFFKHVPAAAPRVSTSGERRKDDSSSSPAPQDPPPMMYYPNGSGGGFWM